MAFVADVIINLFGLEVAGTQLGALTDVAVVFAALAFGGAWLYHKVKKA